MGKIRQLVSHLQRKDYLLRAGGIFTAFISFASAVFGIAGWQLELNYAACFVTAALLLAALLALRKSSIPQISVGTIFQGDVDKKAEIRVRCPCDIKLSAQAKKLAQTCFAGQSTISPDIYEQLRLKNPLILAGLIDRDENLLGYFDVIPLSEMFGQAFIRGLVGEAQISHEDVLPPSAMHQCKYLYLSGLAVHDANKFIGQRNANMLIWAFLKYLEHFYSETNAFAFAVAVTPDGDELLRKFKLRQVADAHPRSDKYKLYTINLSRDEIEKRLDCLPDWSNICSLDWSPIPTKGLLAQRRKYVARPAKPGASGLSKARASGR